MAACSASGGRFSRSPASTDQASSTVSSASCTLSAQPSPKLTWRSTFAARSAFPHPERAPAAPLARRAREPSSMARPSSPTARSTSRSSGSGESLLLSSPGVRPAQFGTREPALRSLLVPPCCQSVVRARPLGPSETSCAKGQRFSICRRWLGGRGARSLSYSYSQLYSF